MSVAEIIAAVWVIEHVGVGAMALWDFVIGPWIWRRRLERRAEQLVEKANDPGGAP